MNPGGDDANFETLVQAPNGDLNLAAAALAIAQDVYPELDRRSYLERLDHMAAEARNGLSANAQTLEVLSRLNIYLFQEQGFEGNREDYTDPRNSYFNDVMDRRRGIPITLSVLYLELAWRLGLRCEGVGFPGHFLVSCALSGGQAVLDPFNAGVSLGEDELMNMARRALGPNLPATGVLGRLLVIVDRRSILSRVLRNLKLIHMAKAQHEAALRVTDKMIVLDPESSVDRLDRARLYDEMGAMRAAASDYRVYLNLASEGPERDAVRARLVDVEKALTRLN